MLQAELARSLAIEPPQVVPLLNKLEERALAVRVRCKPDKRSYGIFLSKTGEALLKELKQIAKDSDREATSALDDEERDQLLRLLKDLPGVTLRRSGANRRQLAPCVGQRRLLFILEAYEPWPAATRSNPRRHGRQPPLRHPQATGSWPLGP